MDSGLIFFIMKLNCLSLFASAGVAETYFTELGINVKVASELLPERVAIYKHLYQDVKMFQGDVLVQSN